MICNFINVFHGHVLKILLYFISPLNKSIPLTDAMEK